MVSLKNVKKRFPGMSLATIGELYLWRQLKKHLVRTGIIDASGFVSCPKESYDPCQMNRLDRYQRLVCVSGFGYSGSGAVEDLLSEYKDVQVMAAVEQDGSLRTIETGFNFEFQLLRSSNGLLSFERILSSHFWDESNCIVHRFLSNIAGLYYEHGYLFRDVFITLTRRFLNQILDHKEPMPMHLSFSEEYPSVGNRGAALIWGDAAKDTDFYYYLKRMSVTEYRRYAGEYLQSFLASLPSKKDFVLDQLVSDATGDISKYKEYLGDNLRVIGIHRDPRDVYASGVLFKQSWIPRDINAFVKWYRVANECYWRLRAPEYLSLKFEELVFDYDNQVRRVEMFLGYPSEAHERPLKSFDPSVSVKNCGIYKKYLSPVDADQISAQLPEFISERI